MEIARSNKVPPPHNHPPHLNASRVTQLLSLFVSACSHYLISVSKNTDVCCPFWQCHYQNKQQRRFTSGLAGTLETKQSDELKNNYPLGRRCTFESHLSMSQVFFSHNSWINHVPTVTNVGLMWSLEQCCTKKNTEVSLWMPGNDRSTGKRGWGA